MHRYIVVNNLMAVFLHHYMNNKH